MTVRKPSKRSQQIKTDSQIPPPVSAEALSLFNVDIDQKGRENIINYLAGQAPSEVVKHAEKVKIEYTAGGKYEVWDVITDKERWWVITNLTNLYSQKLFPSLDYTLSFHIGLMIRLAARQEKKAEILDTFSVAWRKWDQASEALERAEEPEDYQSVGMRCREALLAFIKDGAKLYEVEHNKELPKSGDFKAWSDLLLNQWVPGQSVKELRSYLKNNAQSVWQLVNWITHASTATHYDAHLAIAATESVLGGFQLLIRNSQMACQKTANDVVLIK